MAGILNPATGDPAKYSTTLAAAADPLISVRNLVKTHGSADQGNLVTVLDGVDVDFSRGQFNVIMGTSGAGKSSFIRCVAGLDSFDSGSVTVNGQDLAQMSVAERSEFRLDTAGIIFAAHNLVPSLSVEENIELPALLRRQPVDEDRLEVLVRQLGLQDKLKLLPEDLSVEVRQKVACARALVMQPEVIFADEPTANLDTEATDQILAFLRWATRDRQETVVLSTHDPNVACYADRVLFLRDGRILAQLENPTPDALVDAQRAVNEMRPSVPSADARESARVSSAEILPRSRRISPYVSEAEKPAVASLQAEALVVDPGPEAAAAATSAASDIRGDSEEIAPSAPRSHKARRAERRRGKASEPETSFEVEIPDNPLRMSGDMTSSGFSWPRMKETSEAQFDTESAAIADSEMPFRQVVAEPDAPAAEPAARAETFEDPPITDKPATGAPTFFSIREFAREMGNSPLEDTQGDLRLGDGLVARVNQSVAEKATRYRQEPLRRSEFEQLTVPDEARSAQPVQPVVPDQSAPSARSVKPAPKRASIVPSVSSVIPAATAASIRSTSARSPETTAAPVAASASPLESMKAAKPSLPAEPAKTAAPLMATPTKLPAASKLTRSESFAAAPRTPKSKPVETAPAETPRASNTPKRPRRRTLDPREAEQRGQDELMEKIRQAERLLEASKAAITDASRDLNQAESEARKAQEKTGYRGNAGLPKAGQTPDQELLIARADAMMAQANLRSAGLRESLRRLDSAPRSTSES